MLCLAIHELMKKYYFLFFLKKYFFCKTDFESETKKANISALQKAYLFAFLLPQGHVHKAPIGKFSPKIAKLILQSIHFHMDLPISKCPS